MNTHAFEVRWTDLEMVGKARGDAWGYPRSFKPAGRLTMVMAWQKPSGSDFALTKKNDSSFHAACAVIFMVIFAITAVLGTYYACELLAQRVQNMQLLPHSRPQASISDIRKYANPR